MIAHKFVGDEVAYAVGGICEPGGEFLGDGGEEFTVILPETNPANALAVAGIILERVCAHPFPYRETQPGAALTVSIGVAGNEDGLPEADRLLLAADRALYQAKGAGRNRVVAL